VFAGEKFLDKSQNIQAITQKRKKNTGGLFHSIYLLTCASRKKNI